MPAQKLPHRLRLSDVGRHFLALFSLAATAAWLPDRSAADEQDSSQAAAAEPAPSVVSVPEAWRAVPKGDLAPADGFSWYVTTVRVPENWQGDALELHVEAVDDARQIFVNGQLIGVLGSFPPTYRSGLGSPGRLSVTADVAAARTPLTVAVRVFQDDPRPNFSVAAPVLLNGGRSEGMRLAGEWNYAPSASTDPPSAASLTPFAEVDEVSDPEQYIRFRAGDTRPLSPDEALAGLQVPDDLAVDLVLSEPQIAQPLYMQWDERGRLWVAEYRQYPDPAGLTMVSRDVYLRSVYDKVPPPPPNHFPGLDRISIHEDTDGDGLPDKHSVFADGLNIATSMAVGRGGVYITNPPYLLFYPDRDGDDIPDGHPEILLEGFGLEDSHSVINSLRFGPDGWLYGCQGSTVTGRVKRYGSDDPPVLTMGQQIWRFHPEQRKFEVFAEGGGNTFGLEINRLGEIFSGHNGGDTRGFHYVQGGYYRKGFGKHGPLSNPFAFGYFEAMKHHQVPRFTHCFVICEDTVLPPPYHGRLFGIEPLQGQVVMSDIRPLQSSWETSDIARILQTDDPWFRPVDIKVGPDGCLYVADMYEQRIDHSSHYAGRIDRTNGRIYRIRPKQLPESDHPDYSEATAEQLISALAEEPRRTRQHTILRVLGDRFTGTPAADSLAAEIMNTLTQSDPDRSLPFLWALNAVGGLTENRISSLIGHQSGPVRAWTVRIACDDGRISDTLASAFRELALNEADLMVRKQLASSARRIPPEQALPIVAALVTHDGDADDVHQPLLIWWAVEAHCANDTARNLTEQLLFSDPSVRQRRLMQQTVLERLMRRYVSGTREEAGSAARLLRRLTTEQASTGSLDEQTVAVLMRGFEAAFEGRSLSDLPTELLTAVRQAGGGSAELRLRTGDPEELSRALRDVADPQISQADRIRLLNILAVLDAPPITPVLLELLETDNGANGAVQQAAVRALAADTDPKTAERLINRWAKLPSKAREAAESVLVSRLPFAQQFVNAVENRAIAHTEVSLSAVRRMLLHRNDELAERIESVWGTVEGASTEAMNLESARLNRLLLTASGNPKAGKPLFMKNCGRCHLLFGEGGRIGPDLTAFQRTDTSRMLAAVINPDLEIREGFETQVIITTDGRVITGFLADRDPNVVVIRTAEGTNAVIPTDDIEEQVVSPRSVMPQGTLREYTDEQIIDLFAYLRSSQPVNY